MVMMGGMRLSGSRLDPLGILGIVMYIGWMAGVYTVSHVRIGDA